MRGPLARFLVGLTLVVGGVVAVVGGLALRGPGPVALGVAVVLAACVGAGVARESRHPDRRSVAESALLAAGGTFVVLLFVTGTTVLAGPSAAVLLVVASGGVAAVVWLVRGQRPSRPSPVASSSFPAAPTGSAMPPVSAMSTQALGREWLLSSAALTGPRLAATARQQLARRRQETLDELELRDPAGFARWIAGGPAHGSDPAAFVHGERTAGTDAA